MKLGNMLCNMDVLYSIFGENDILIPVTPNAKSMI